MQNKPAALPQFIAVGHHTLRAWMLSGYSYQAQHNSFAWSQTEREDRLRVNLEKLEAMRKPTTSAFDVPATSITVITNAR